MSQRLKVLRYIEAEIEAGRPFPCRADIAKHMGWRNTSSTTDVLWALVKDGHLVADGYSRKPNFRLPPKGKN